MAGRSKSPKSGEPEVRQFTFGILPLTDCAPIVVAHAKGFFLRHGIESSVMKFGSWTASRDALMSGRAQAAHMLFGMPVAAAVGKLGTQHKPLVIPWILNRNGQAITVSVRHREILSSNARDLRALAQERREKGRPMVFAMTLRPAPMPCGCVIGSRREESIRTKTWRSLQFRRR